MSAHKLRVGIIGCGKMGCVHAQIFSRNEDCVVAGLYNRTRSKAAALQQRYPQAKVYNDWQSMMDDENIDVLTITTPAAFRCEQYEYNAEHQRKPLFTEKPIAMDSGEIKRILKRADKTNTYLHVDSQVRNHPAVLATEGVLSRIGRIFHVDMEFSMYREDNRWKHSKIAGGGVLKELCGHLIDLADSWLGKARQVFAVNKTVMPGREVEDFSVNLITYENHASLMLCGHYYEHKDRVYKIRILGDQGQIDCTFSSYDPADSKVTLYIKDNVEEIPVRIPNTSDICSIYPGHLDSFQKEVDIFIRNVKRGAHTVDTIEKERRTMEIIDASYASSASGKAVFIR